MNKSNNAVKERPILMNAAMVRATLDGNKTQTRRICKRQPYPNGYHWDGNDILCHNDYLPPSAMLMDFGGRRFGSISNLEGWESECPHGQPGDHLWVRESFSDVYGAEGDDERRKQEVMYRANGETDPYVIGGRWTPSIHMPRWASRITLEIVSVRIDRLNDISEADARAEGCSARGWMPSYSNPDNAGCDESVSAADAFSELWESINGPESWAANPWVWVIEFKRVAP